MYRYNLSNGDIYYQRADGSLKMQKQKTLELCL